MDFQASHDTSFAAAQAAEADRSRFILRTYLHLFGALVAFVLLLAFWFVSGVASAVMGIFALGKFGILLFMGAFMGTSWLADRWARSDASPAMQYAGLGLYTVAESLVFIPLIGLALVATAEGDTMILPRAFGVTGLLFGIMTVVVVLTRQNFSFMRSLLFFGGAAASVAVLGSVIFGFTLGVFFTYAMIALACGYILYQTSGILHEYRTDQHVSAALALFSSVTLLLYYVLRLFLSRRN